MRHLIYYAICNELVYRMSIKYLNNKKTSHIKHNTPYMNTNTTTDSIDEKDLASFFIYKQVFQFLMKKTI